MKTKRIKSFLIAAVIVFESVVMGWVPANAQTVSVSENAVAEQEVADVAENVTEESAVNEGKETSTNSENITAETEVAAYASDTDGDLTWTLDADGHLTITGTGNYADRENNLTGGWLAHASKIKSATVDVSGITDTSYMFYNCSSLQSLDLTKLETNNVTDMSYMFYECSSLKSLDLSSFITSNVKNMAYMFYNCYGLEKLKLNGNDSVLQFQTYMVTDMTAMFARCSNLETLNLTGFSTRDFSDLAMEEINLDLMFLDCSELTRLIISEDLSNPLSLPTYGEEEYPYDWIYGPTGEEVSEITSAGTYIRADIYGGTPITHSGTDGDLYWEIDENGHLLIMGEGDYKTRTDTSSTGWLAHRDSIVTATVDVKGITKTNSMFQSCEKLASVDLENLDTSAVTDMHNMFDSCYNLARLDVRGFNTAKVENMSYMFNGCFVLVELDVSGFDTANVTNMDHMFTACRLLTELDVTGFDTKKVTCMDYMFAACDDLESLDLSNFSTDQLDLSMMDMLTDCTNLTVVTAPENQSTEDMLLPVGNYGWRYQPTGETVEKMTKAGTYMRSDVYEAENMIVHSATEGKISWELNKNGHLLITGEGDYEERLWLEHKDEIISATVNVTGITYTSGMFEGCSDITELDLTGLDTSEVTDMSNMLSDCTNLTILKAPEIPSSVELKLPVTNHIWIYEETGTSVTKVMGAGTYTRKDNLGEPVEPGVVPAPVTPKEEPKATVETTVKTDADGSVTKTVKTTEPNGEITLKIVSTSKDKKKETIVDMTISASGQLKDAAVEVANVTKTSKMTINLNELKALVDQVTLCNTEYVYPVGSKPYVPEKVDSLGDICRKAQEAVGVAQKKANVAIKVSAKSPSGQKKYSVAIKKTDLTKKKFVVYGSDKKGNAVMVNTKKNKATVNKKKDLTFKVAKKGDYQLQNTKDAKKTNKKIMKTVKPKKSSVTVKKGKSTSFKLSSKCNKDNISKIKYSSDNSKVKVSKKGKISAKGSGTAKVTATVTMKNGQKKKIKVKVKVS